MNQEKANKENANTQKYNILMPQSDDRALCFQIDKPISKEGYAENFVPRTRAMIERHGGIRLLLYFTGYKGWEPEAALANMGILTEFGPKVIRFALVNPPKKEILRAKVNEPLVSGETRVFDAAQLDEAIEWVKG